jgi:Ser/Thr protein kinase RdoA (MazF antagonist)
MRKKLESKQNAVFLVECNGEKRIEKHFSRPERLKTEMDVMNTLRQHGIPVPNLLGCDRNTVYYEYIEGISVLDVLDTTDAYKYFYRLINWLCAFYTAMHKTYGCGWILGDIHLRNFLIRAGDGEIIGVDFEECRPGAPETDIVRLCAFMVMYSPAFTSHKIRLAAWMFHTMCDMMELDMHLCRESLDHAFLQISTRRGQTLPAEKVQLLKMKMFV